MAEKVQIDLVAQDKASKTIDDVADDVAKLEKADPKVTITAQDKASDDVGDVLADVKDLEALDPTVTIGAVDHASDDISAIRTEANDLTDRDREIVLKARVDSAKADLASLQGELRTTTEKAEETARTLDRVDSGGSNLRGNAIADLTGPLGEASGAASDFAGVFDGLGDIAEGVVGKLGGSAETAAKVSSALGALGVGVAAGAALWSLWTTRQEEARRKMEETRQAYIDLQKTVKEGDLKKAAEDFLKMHDAAFDVGRQLGLTDGEITNFIDGVGGTKAEVVLAAGELENLRAKLDGYGGKLDDLSPKEQRRITDLENLIGPLVDARDETRENTGVYDLNEQAISDVAFALGDHVAGLGDSMKAQDLQRDAIEKANDELRKSEEKTDDAAGSQRDFARDLAQSKRDADNLRGALELLRTGLDQDQAILNFQENFTEANKKIQEGTGLTSQEILDLKGDVLSVAEFAGLNPVEVQSLLHDVDNQDIASVLFEVQSELNKEENKVRIQSKIDRPGQIGGGSAGGAGGAGPRSAGPEVGTINMHLPAGWRGDPMRTVHAARRRTGRLFAR